MPPTAQEALRSALRITAGKWDDQDYRDVTALLDYLRGQAGNGSSEQASSARFGAAMSASERGWPRGGGIGSTDRFGSGETPSYDYASDIGVLAPATDTPDLVMLPAITDEQPMRPNTFPGFVKFQSGPVLEAGVNGTSMEAVLRIVLDRLLGYQRGPFPCTENDNAAGHISQALEQLDLRTLRRRRQGVEGINVAHASA